MRVPAHLAGSCSLPTGPTALLISACASLLILAPPLVAQEETPAIADNSFLIEEAYNQEAGVVQHISAFSRVDKGDWLYTFTQEWPLFTQRHQVSFTLPVIHDVEQVVFPDFPGGPQEVSSTGLGDIGLNYRYQLAGMGGEGPVAFAPRATVNFPTGSEEAGRGEGALGLQINLPVSAALGSGIVTHYNAGATLVPSAGDGFGAEATTASYNLGASLIWLARPTINLLVEAVWLSSESVAGPGVTDRDEEAFLNPGVRWAFNFASGLQIVPGVAYTIGIGPSNGNDAVFVYLSFEHAFKAVEAGR